jgi:hypothetical protein
MNASPSGPRATASLRANTVENDARARVIKLLRFVQRPFGWVFWIIERRIAALDVENERRRT